MKRIFLLLVAVLSTVSLNAQDKKLGHLYSSEGMYFSEIGKSECAIQFSESIGYRFHSLAVFVPISVEERLYNMNSYKNYDFQGLLGLGISERFNVYRGYDMELALSGQSTVTRSDFRYALFRAEARVLQPVSFMASYIGVGAQYYKMYNGSFGKDVLSPFVVLGFSF